MAAPGATAVRPKAPVVQQPAASGGGGGVIPFVRGSGLGRYLFFDKSGVTLLTNTQDLGPIPVKAYDYMSGIVVEVNATSAGGGSAVTLPEDSPGNFFTTVKVDQPNGQTMYSVSSGFSAILIHAHGGYAGNNDPRAWQSYANSTGGGTAPTSTFPVRIPFQINVRDALGSLPNKDANAPFNLYLSVNTLANVFGGSPTTPTYRVRAWLEAWDQPPSVLNGQQVETTPPNMNTLQRWTNHPIAYSAGQLDLPIPKPGNYLRMLLPIARRSSSTRANGDSDWPDPLQVVLDEDVKDNIAKDTWTSDIYE